MTDTDSSRDVTNRRTKPTEGELVQDEGLFTHWTGDTYQGWFKVNKKDKSIKMQGPGIYTTAEGEQYSGFWESNNLGGAEETTIKFVDGSVYQGLLKDWTMTGTGKYTYPDHSILHCNFVDNCPVGNLSLTDPNEHTWLGTAHQGFGWVEPINHYYEMLEATIEVPKIKKRPKTEPKNQTEVKFEEVPETPKNKRKTK